MCSDSVGGYDCVCKSGFTGVHCENGEEQTLASSLLIHISVCAVTAATFAFCFHDADVTQCTVESGKGCSQFCKPGYTSYECSCAQGWKLSRSDRNKCEPAGTSVSSIKFQLKLKCFFFFFSCYSLHICSVYQISHQKQKREKFTFHIIVFHDGSSYFFPLI